MAADGIYADLVKLQMSGHEGDENEAVNDRDRARTISEDIKSDNDKLSGNIKGDRSNTNSNNTTALDSDVKGNESESFIDKLWKKPTPAQVAEAQEQAALKKRIWGYAMENPMWLAVGKLI